MRSLGAAVSVALLASACLEDNPLYQGVAPATDGATSGGSGPEQGTSPGASDGGASGTAQAGGSTGTEPEPDAPDTSGDGSPSATSTGSDTSSTGETGLGGDDALVIRYFLDEQPDGVPGQTVLDSAQPPQMDLDVFHDVSDDAPLYVTDDGHRGLRWAGYGGGGRAQAPVADSKLEVLSGATALTMEVVAEVTSVFPTVEPWARLVVWQPDVVPYEIDLGLLAARANGEFVLDVRGSWHPNNSPQVGRWAVGDPTGRVVVHLVIDTQQAFDDRVRMYVGGERISPDIYEPPDLKETLAVDPDGFLVLGNRPASDASIGGALYYVALYDRALNAGEIAANAAWLTVDDDGP